MSLVLNSMQLCVCDQYMPSEVFAIYILPAEAL